MYVGLKQPRGDGERYVTPARAAAKETTIFSVCCLMRVSRGFVRSIHVKFCIFTSVKLIFRSILGTQNVEL